MADNTNVSLADVIKRNQRLKSHAKAATNAVSNRDYTGPPGDVVCKFDQLRMIEKDGNTYAILNFRVDGGIADQAEHNGAQCSMLHSLSDSERATAEQGLDRLMMDIQRLGIETANRDISDIEKELAAKKGKHFTLSAVLGKSGNGRLYYNIRGVYTAQSEWKEEEAENEDFDDDDNGVLAVPAKDSDDSEDLDEVEDLDTPEAEPEPDYAPSDWIGYECFWTHPKTKKEDVYKVVDANDAEQTVVLEKDGKRVRVKYSDIKAIPF